MAMLTSLVSYYALDEASGNGLDSHGSNTLTDTNTVAAATGKVSGCRDFELSNSEKLTINDNASFSVGDIDFSIAAWFNGESFVSGSDENCIVGKRADSNAATGLEYWLRQNAGNLQFLVSSDGGVGGLSSVTWSATPSTATWYFVVVWHDSVNNQIGIQVNDGTAVTAAHSTGVVDGTAPFVIGATGAGAGYFDGLIDEVAFAKRIWTPTEKTWIYNSGNGRSYADWAATEVTVRQTTIIGGGVRGIIAA